MSSNSPKPYPETNNHKGDQIDMGFIGGAIEGIINGEKEKEAILNGKPTAEDYVQWIGEKGYTYLSTIKIRHDFLLQDHSYNSLESFEEYVSNSLVAFYFSKKYFQESDANKDTLDGEIQRYERIQNLKCIMKSGENLSMYSHTTNGEVPEDNYDDYQFIGWGMRIFDREELK